MLYYGISACNKAARRPRPRKPLCSLFSGTGEEGAGWMSRANEKDLPVPVPCCSPSRTERLSAVQLDFNQILKACKYFFGETTRQLCFLEDTATTFKENKTKQSSAHTHYTHILPTCGTGSATRPVLLLQCFLVTCRVMHFSPSYKQFNHFQSCFSMLWNQVVLVSIPSKTIQLIHNLR